MSDSIRYTIRGALRYPKATAAKKARKLLAKSELAPPALEALDWDGDRGFSVEFEGPLARGVEWGAGLQALSLLATEATGGEVIVSMLDERRVVQPGGGVRIEVPEVPERALFRLGSLSLRANHAVRAVAVSSDGRRIAAASKSRDTRSGGLEKAPWSKPGAGYWRSFWGDGDIRVWDGETGALTHMLLPCSNGASRLEFSPDGRYLLAIGERLSGFPAAPGRNWSAGAYLFDLETGATRALVKTKVCDVAFSADGALLATCTPREAVIWQTAKAKKGIKVARRAADLVGVAFADTDECLVVFSDDGEIRKALIDDGGEEAPGSAEGPVQKVLAATGDGIVWVQRERKVFVPISLDELAPSGDPVAADSLIVGPGRAVALAHDRQKDPDHPEVGWSLQPAGDVWRSSIDPWDVPGAFTPDGALVVTGRMDCSLRFLDPLTGASVPRPGQIPEDVGHAAHLVATTFAPDGRIATSSSAPGLRIWGPDGALQTTREQTSYTEAIAFAPDCSWLAAFYGKRLYLHDLSSAEVVEHELDHGRQLAITPDGTRAVMSISRGLIVLDRATGEERRVHVGEYISDLLVLSDERAVLTSDRKLFEIDLAGPTQTREILPAGGALLARAPDGAIVSATALRALRIDPERFEVVEGDPFTTKESWREVPYYPRAISPDGRWIAETQGIVLRVRGAASGEVLWSAVGHTAEFDRRAFAFSADSRLLITGGEEGTAVVWRVQEEPSA